MPKVRLVGCNLTAGADAPVPLSATVCGLPAASSPIEMLALRLPLALGENVALMVQLAPAASVVEPVGHVLVCAKSPALVPVIPILLMERADVPLLVSVVVCEGLVVFTAWLAKVRLVGFRATVGGVVVVLMNLLRIFVVIFWLTLLA